MKNSDPLSTANGATTILPSQLLHDLRGPLSQIIGYSELLAEDEDDEEARRRRIPDLQRITSAGRAILAIIDANFTTVDRRVLVAPLPAADTTYDVTHIRRRRVSSPGTLLVVDDDLSNREVLGRRLEKQGHRVQAASSGAEALQRLTESPYDLVLLDVMMPEMDGHEVLRRMKSEPALQHIPVIMISALNEMSSVVRCIDAGAEDYLAKPFDATLLRARIEACLETKRSRDRELVLFGQLQANFKRLQEVERLRDDMRNMIVHDLRTPLTGVILGVEMLAKLGDLNDGQQEMVSIASAGGRTLLAMINDLLEVEKMESGTSLLDYSIVDAGALIATALEQVSSLASEAGIELITKIQPGLPEFDGDARKLSRTLVNLLANAIKFTEAGSVTVSARIHDASALAFAVHDTGSGIPAEAFDRIFEKFGQLDAHDKVGTGLGLAFCKLAVEAHGGVIRVESEPGRGSTFTFVIPCRRDRREA